MFRRLQPRFTLIFVSTTITPLLIIGLLIGMVSIDRLSTQAQERLIETANTVAQQIETFITTRTQELNLMMAVTGLPDDEAGDLLQNLLLRTDAYERITLLDNNANVIHEFSRSQTIDGPIRTSNLEMRTEYVAIITGNPVYYSDVFIDANIREPLMTVSLPLSDRRTGTLRGVVIAEFRFRPIWELLTDLDLDGDVNVFVTDPLMNNIIAHADPSVVLRGTQFTPSGDFGRGNGQSADDVLFAVQELPVGGNRLLVIAEQPVSTALAIAQQLGTLTLLVIVLATISAIAVVTLAVRHVVQPIKRLSDTAQQIQSGDLSMRADVTSRDEIGDLAQAFNNMTAQLQDLIANLERRVEDRTRDLQVAVDVSKQVATVLNLPDLLPLIVERTKSAYGLYHVSIYQHDADQNRLQLAAATGTAGTIMMEMENYFRLDQPGLIPAAARARKPVLVNNVLAADDHLPNPLLPLTRAELAVPMIVGDTLLGVLDLQSSQFDAFDDDDLRLLQSLAEQLGVAVQNATLYAQQLEITEELRRLDNMKSQFLASMSHELRTPLNAILNFTQFVRMGKLGDVNAKQVDALGKAIKSGEHLLSLINDVLDVAKIEAGMMELFVEDDVDLKIEIDTVVASTSTLLDDKPVVMRVDVQKDLPNVVGDRRRIRQIMLNLVSNACKYTSHGSVHIKAYAQDDVLTFSVADTGMGIPPEEHALIFESFRQTREGLRTGNGTGLGLAISHRLAQEHYGTLTFTSEVGSGSTFILMLPVRAPELLKQVF